MKRTLGILSQVTLRCSVFLGLFTLTFGLARAQSVPASGTDSSQVADIALPSVSNLRQSLTEGDLEERREAANQSLHLSSSELAVLLPDFIELLRHDGDGQIRLAVFDALRKMGPTAGPAVPALVNAIRKRFGGRYNEELHQNYRAALVLAEIGGEAVEALRNLLLEDSESVRAEAAMALGRIGPSAASATPDLIPLLGDESDRVRRDAVAALAGIGSPTTASLLEAFQQDNARIRSGALDALAQASPGDPRVAELIILSLEDESAEIRKVACKSLDRLTLADRAIGEHLIARLQDDEDEVRVAAVDVLVAKPSLISKLRPQLAQLLSLENNEDSQDRDRMAWYAAFLIQELGAESLPTLLNAAERESSRLQQLARAISLIDKLDVKELYRALDLPNSRVSQVAALALGEIRPVLETTIESLEKGLLGDDDQLQLACLTSLSKLGSQAARAVPGARRLADHQDEEIRQYVVEVLSHAAPRDDRLLADLKHFVQDSSPSVQLSAIASLQTLGPTSRSAIPIVMRALHSRTPAVRKAVLEFLSSHGSAAADSVPLLSAELSQDLELDWRTAVIATLGRIGRGAKPAFAELVNCLDDQSPEVREVALDAISKLGLPVERISAKLLEALSDPDESVRSRASSIIRRMGADGVLLIPDLIPLLTTEELQKDIERLLTRMERYPTDSSSTAALLELTRNENKLVQQNAIRFLGLLPHPDGSIIKTLQRFAEHESEALQQEAIQALEKIDDEKDL